MALPVVQMHILLTNNKSHLINDPLALTQLPLRADHHVWQLLEPGLDVDLCCPLVVKASKISHLKIAFRLLKKSGPTAVCTQG